MNAGFHSLLCIAVLCSLLYQSATAQDPESPRWVLHRPTGRNSLETQPRRDFSAPGRISGKKASEYTAQDWGKLIDSTWGAGQPATEQLQIFDSFWGAVDTKWAAFPNLPLNWDSIKTLYRPQIGSGLSRGRFYALMSRLYLALMEFHTRIWDMRVDSIFIPGGIWNYKRGVPLMITGNWWWDFLGAAVTPMPDSTNFVYRTDPGNPLGLEPGDLVLGYEGIPWKSLYRQLLDAGLPVSCYWSQGGSTPESQTYAFLTAIGCNVGMFDTIDVVKFSSGDTLHLPTSLLDTPSFKSIFPSDQVPIAGVPMPTGPVDLVAVSYGVVQGTSIGYIYVWDWATTQTRDLFQTAVDYLIHVRKVEGLIIDSRVNLGGTPGYANGGLSQLFNTDPTSSLRLAFRTNPADHMGFSLQTWDAWSFTPGPLPFDHPIAVLIGPGCLSSGDLNAFRLRLHPMARLFGKPTNAAYAYRYYDEVKFSDAWEWSFPTSSVYSNLPGEGYLMHRGVQPDEEVWLTRDGVAKGEDAVVKRALEWISTVSYSHDLQLAQVSKDTLRIAARVENPLSHALTVTVTLRNDQGALLDSVNLAHTGGAGDNLWTSSYVPPADGTIHASIRTEDLTSASSRALPNAAHLLFTRGPIIAMDISSWNMGKVSSSLTACDTSFFVTNRGYAKDSLQVTVTEDSSLAVSPTLFMLAPGDSQRVTFTVRPSLLPPNVYDAQVFVKSWLSVGQPSFTKTIRFEVVTGVEEEKPLPSAFLLEQNYPNPFNPKTVVRSQLPVVSNVRLVIFDLVGREVAVLVNERRVAGTYTDTFDASGLASGLYFYRLTAGAYVETRKMVLMK